MNCNTSIASELDQAPTPSACSLKLPMGLLGFEQTKDYLLISDPAEDPFCWLQMEDNPALAFVIVQPFFVEPDYQPDIPEPDVRFLGLTSPQDALLYNIVTLRGPHEATVNLKGPVVFNRHSGIGKQVIIANAAQYSVQHPVLLADAAVE